MIRRALRSLAATWLAGFLVMLPLAVTAALVGWLGSFVYGLVGPGTWFGRLSAALGYPLASHPGLAYLLGTLVLAAAVYGLGLVAQSRLQRRLASLADHTVRRIPLIGNVYGLADRFVGLLNQKQEADIGAMRPVWCFFGGDGGALLYVPVDWVRSAEIGVDKLTATYVSMGIAAPV